MSKHFDGVILEGNTSVLDQVQVRIVQEESIAGRTVLDITLQESENEDKVVIVEIQNCEQMGTYGGMDQFGAMKTEYR